MAAPLSTHLLVLLLWLPLLSSCQAADPPAPEAPHATSTVATLGIVGDTSDVTTPTQGGYVLMGGSTDVDSAMHWMIARSGGGDAIILRASGGTGYNDYLFSELGGLNSVETLRIDTRAKALDAHVGARIRQAEMVFIAGGDQGQYVNLWQSTPVTEALNYLAQVKKVPIGGTSAGCAVLGFFAFSAQVSTINSEEALANPFDSRITLTQGYLKLPGLERVLTDQHFSQRSRQGRLAVFMARLYAQGADTVLGIAVDEKTALLVSPEGAARVVGANQVTLLWATPGQGAPEALQEGIPLTWARGGKALSAWAMTQTSQPLNIAQWPPAPPGGQVGFWHITAGSLTRP